MDRRDFLKSAGVAAGIAAMRGRASAAQHISLVVDPADAIASAPPVAWAIREVESALTARGATSRTYPRIDAAPGGDRCLVIAGGASSSAQQILRSANATLPATVETLCLVPGNAGGRPALLAAGSDARGLVYAVLDVADRVKRAAPDADPL